MTYTYIQNKLVEIFADHFGVSNGEIEGITTKSELYEKFEPDSLDEVELVMCIEDTFNIEFLDDENMKWCFLQDIVKDVAKKCRVDTPDTGRPSLLQIQVTKQEKQIKALQEQLKEYNELKEVLKRIING